MSKTLVIYHGNCADGFTAAWLANIAHSHTWNKPIQWNVDAHAGVYGEAPPDCTGRNVFILDFSYAPDVMLQIAAQAGRVTWIDHHKTAIEAMDGVEHPNLVKVLSTERSGAYLTSQFFWPDREPEDMVKLVDDRDRWVFRDPRSKPFAAGMFSRHYTIEDWNAIANNVDQTIEEGAAVLRKHWKDIRELLDVMTVHKDIAGFNVPTANLSYVSASDACHELLERHSDAPFAACWFLRKDGKKVFSLRSRSGSDVDVSAIAKKFGGGGHMHAAGFAVVEWPGRESA